MICKVYERELLRYKRQRADLKEWSEQQRNNRSMSMLMCWNTLLDEGCRDAWLRTVSMYAPWLRARKNLYKPVCRKAQDDLQEDSGASTHIANVYYSLVPKAMQGRDVAKYASFVKISLVYSLRWNQLPTSY